jgi:hypothetical protein
VRFRSEFFHVPGKIELQGIQSAANIAALLLWQGFHLLSRLFFDLKPVTHRRVAAIDYCPCPENPRRSSVKIFSARAPLQRTRNDAFKAARCGPHTAGKLSARHFKHPCPIRGIRGSACNWCHSCPFVVKRNQLDGESRRTDRGMVGKEHARESSLKLVSGTGKSPKRAMNKIIERTVLNRKQNGVS